MSTFSAAFYIIIKDQTLQKQYLFCRDMFANGLVNQNTYKSIQGYTDKNALNYIYLLTQSFTQISFLLIQYEKRSHIRSQSCEELQELHISAE